MIIKVMGTEGDFTLYENVKSVKYTNPNKDVECPQVEFDDFSWDMYLANNGENGKLSKSSHEERYLLGNRHLADDRIIHYVNFEGKLNVREDTTDPFKIVSFILDSVEYVIVTNLPVYICDNRGKTLETVQASRRSRKEAVEKVAKLLIK